LSATAKRYLLVVNSSSRRHPDEAIVEQARQRLGDVEWVRLGPEPDLHWAVGAAVREGRVVVAVGGDGTVNAVAQYVVGTDGLFGVLPMGTLNHFARDLGLRSVGQAIGVLASGRARTIDAGRMDGGAFVNNAVLGVYPEAVRERERCPAWMGKWPAMALGAVRSARRARPITGTMLVDGDPRTIQAWTVFVGNNRYAVAPGRIARRDRLDEGVLDVRLLIAEPTTALPRTRRAWRALYPRPLGPGRYVRTEAREVEVQVDEDARYCATDGEVRGPVQVFRAKIEPGALRVLAP
jgi:diacylglycerol kinase family enzyme